MNLSASGLFTIRSQRKQAGTHPEDTRAKSSVIAGINACLTATGAGNATTQNRGKRGGEDVKNKDDFIVPLIPPCIYFNPSKCYILQGEIVDC